jgi:hypothetical protein
MSVLSFISSIFKPAVDLIDDLHTSDEEKMVLQKEFMKLENEIMLKAVELEKQLVEANSSNIKAEATGHSWLQRNWRPITMLTFLVLVVFDSFGWLANPLAAEAWTLLQIGLGGYVAGRSLEKIVPKVKISRNDNGVG